MAQFNHHQFLGISTTTEESAEALLLPLPYEKTVSYGKGTRGGPAAILKASLQVETFEEETLVDFESDLPVFTFPPLETAAETSVPEYLQRVEEFLRPRRGRFIVGLGGEHSVTYGMILGLVERLDELTIVQIDAHADLIDRLDGQYWSHGTVMRRLWEKGCRLVQISVRSLSRSEYELARGDQRISTYFAHQLPERWRELIDHLHELEGPIFLTLDVDGLDPAILPSTGTPQPNGLTWRQTGEILRTLAFAPRVEWIGADVVEFVPSPQPPGCDLTAARLVQKIFAWWHCGCKRRVR